MSELLARIEQLELNQQRLLVLACDAPEEHKAFDRACFVANLTFEQEAQARTAIVDFLNSDKTDVDQLCAQVEAVVSAPAHARALISAFKLRDTAPERWAEIDPENRY